MRREESFQPYPGTRFVPRLSEHPESGPYAPSRNRILAALPPEDYERLLPELEPVSLPPGLSLHDCCDREKYLYFVTAGIVARSYVTENGESAAFSVTGSEGVIGVATFLGGEGTPSQASVLTAGHAYRLGKEPMHRAFEQFGPLTALLLRSTLALITQVTQTAVCNRHHSVEQQLCRWLLACTDRMPSHELALTQEKIGEMLGVRREAVTEAAGHLQAAGLIRYNRGHIAILDRGQLEARSCECYAVVKREYERLLPESRNDEQTGTTWNRRLSS